MPARPYSPSGRFESSYLTEEIPHDADVRAEAAFDEAFDVRRNARLYEIEMKEQRLRVDAEVEKSRQYNPPIEAEIEMLKQGLSETQEVLLNLKGLYERDLYCKNLVLCVIVVTFIALLILSTEVSFSLYNTRYQTVVCSAACNQTAPFNYTGSA